MAKLEDYKKEVFEEKTTLKDTLISRYFKYNELKKKAEKWLKENGTVIKEAMITLGKDKKDFGQYRVAVTIPNTGKFNEEKVLTYLSTLLSKKEYSKVTLVKLNEDALTALIEAGKVDLDLLKAAAFEENTGAPKLVISKVKK